jgi:2-hydroxychromene-2-carboxylate isomerase
MLDVRAGGQSFNLRSRASSAIHGPTALPERINLGEMPSTAAFYFDLASPLAYLAAERMLHVFADAPEPVEWRPALARELRGASVDADAPAPEEIERRARELGLQPLRWPDPYPFDSSFAMRAATYAASIGRTVPFAQAAFRQSFAGGRSLQDQDFVLIAAAACEMHPAAVLAGAELRSTVQRLADATVTAALAGATDVPAIVLGECVFVGEDAPERAAAHMRRKRGGQEPVAHTQ